MGSSLATWVSGVIGGMVGLGSLCVAIAVGLRRQERRYSEATGQQRQRLEVVQPSSQPAPQLRTRRSAEPELLPPGSRVNFADERRAANIDDVMAALDSDLVGLVPIKRKVEEIASLLLVDRARNRFGLTAPRP